jgi:hypothetical protein
VKKSEKNKIIKKSLIGKRDEEIFINILRKEVLVEGI